MPEYNFPLKERFEVAEGTTAFVFDTSAAPDFTFRAGQYIEIELENPPYTDEKGNERHFSIASSPNDKGILMVATRMRPSAFKRSLAEIHLGTKVKVKGPRGNFVLHENPEKKAAFITGGIGITPVRSIIKYAAEEKLPHKIVLIYSNRNPKSTAFLDDLKKWAGENPNFKLFAKMTDEAGYVDADDVKKNVWDFGDTIFYVVGPPEMVQAMTKILEELKISRDELRFEEFSGY